MQQGPWARKAARRRTGLHTVLALVFLAVAAGAGYLVIVQVPKWLKGPDLAVSPTPAPSSSTLDPLPGCRSPAFPDFASLGSVAWAASGSLWMLDVPTCRQAELVKSGAEGPVRFSGDGEWVAYGALAYVPASGGRTTKVDGATRDWEWSPTGARLAFVTDGGGVSILLPGREPHAILAPSAGRAAHIAWSPNGRFVAADLPDRILVVDVRTFEAHTVFSTTGLSPQVAAWTPDSKWVLFWAKPLGTNGTRTAGRALDAVPAEGGDWRNVWDSMLPFRDFIAACGGHDIAIAGGGQPYVSAGKQVLVSGPPDWSFHNVTQDYIRSWVWPACSPNGKLMAVTGMANEVESRFSGSIRPLWILRLGTVKRTKVSPPGGQFGAYETPRWARDGKTILAVYRKDNEWDADGTIALVEVDPDTGKKLQVATLDVNLGSAPGAGGHQQWTEMTDWYQPPATAASPSPGATPSPPPATSSSPSG